MDVLETGAVVGARDAATAVPASEGGGTTCGFSAVVEAKGIAADVFEVEETVVVTGAISVEGGRTGERRALAGEGEGTLVALATRVTVGLVTEEGAEVAVDLIGASDDVRGVATEESRGEAEAAVGFGDSWVGCFVEGR